MKAFTTILTLIFIPLLLFGQEEFVGFKEIYTIEPPESGGNANKVFVSEGKELLVVKYGGIKKNQRALAFYKMGSWEKVAEVSMGNKDMSLKEAFLVPEENALFVRQPKTTLYYRVDIGSGKIKSRPCKKVPTNCVKVLSKYYGSVTADSYNLEDELVFARKKENLQKIQIYGKN